MNPKKKSLVILLSLLVVAVLAAAFIHRQSLNRASQVSQTQLSNTTSQDPSNNGVQTMDNSSTIDTSDWKTYVSKKIGVEVRYPQDWTVIEQKDSLAGFAIRSSHYKPIQSGQVIYDGEIYVDSISNPKNLKISDRMAELDDDSTLWFKNFPYVSTEIQGYQGVKFTLIKEKSYDRRVILINVGSKILSFDYFFQIEDKNTARIFESVIQSLHLVP